MPLILDGRTFRTEYEQLVHLTEKHIEQEAINKNINNKLLSLEVASGRGGYNLVRFAFEKQGTYYKLSGTKFTNNIENSAFGDYYEVTSGIDGDIPAYGYLNNNNEVVLSFNGDFMAQYEVLTVRNITKNVSNNISLSYVSFDGTGLLDYNPNNVQNQLFNVLEDLAYGAKAQYVSYDLNEDGVYNYVFLGTVINGKDGSGVIATDLSDITSILQKIKINDLLLCTQNGNLLGFPVLVGDILRYDGNNVFYRIGNIRGEKGEKGETGQQGAQGLRGIQGEQGIQGIQGIQGQKGSDGVSLNIHSDIIAPSNLPDFNSVNIGDAWIIINTSNATIQYDLYFKGVGGTDWTIIYNWNSVPIVQGPQGPVGAQGIQGVQGPQGPVGATGGTGDFYQCTISISRTNEVYLSLNANFAFTIFSDVEIKNKSDLIQYFLDKARIMRYPANGIANGKICKMIQTYGKSNGIVECVLTFGEGETYAFQLNLLSNAYTVVYYEKITR